MGCRITKPSRFAWGASLVACAAFGGGAEAAPLPLPSSNTLDVAGPALFVLNSHVYARPGDTLGVAIRGAASGAYGIGLSGTASASSGIGVIGAAGAGDGTGIRGLDAANGVGVRGVYSAGSARSSTSWRGGSRSCGPARQDRPRRHRPPRRGGGRPQGLVVSVIARRGLALGMCRRSGHRAAKVQRASRSASKRCCVLAISRR